MVDEIIIVEGPDATFAKIIGSNRSTDKTISKINNFIKHCDCDSKIQMIHTNDNKNIMIEKGNVMCTGDAIYQVDVDEFCPHEVIDIAFDIIEKGAGMVEVPQRWYYKWTDTYLKFGRPHAIAYNPVRFFKNKLNDGYIITHIPQGFVDIKTKKPHVVKRAIANKKDNIPFSMYSYHFLALFKNQLINKFNYYMKRGDGVTPKMVQRVTNEFDKVMRPPHEKARSEQYRAPLEIEERPFPVEINKSGDLNYLPGFQPF